jgi:hypothetical protein
MAITLDGHTYHVAHARYERSQTKFTTERRTVTGDLDITEVPYFANTYNLVLMCDLEDIAALRATYAKVQANDHALLLTDEEGITWDPAPGTNTPTHIYNTGVHWSGPLLPKPVTPRGGWASTNRFEVTITLTPIAKVLP